MKNSIVLRSNFIQPVNAKADFAKWLKSTIDYYGGIDIPINPGAIAIAKVATLQWCIDLAVRAQNFLRQRAQPSPAASIHPSFHGCPTTHHTGTCKGGFVYILKSTTGPVKVGCTMGHLRQRFANAERQYNLTFYPVAILETHCALGLETFLHKALAPMQIDTPAGKELFQLPDHIIARIAAIRNFAGNPVTALDPLDYI